MHVIFLFSRDIYFKALPAVHILIYEICILKQKATQKAGVCLNTYRSSA